jgi:hypothetical protein
LARARDNVRVKGRVRFIDRAMDNAWAMFRNEVRSRVQIRFIARVVLRFRLRLDLCIVIGFG